MARFIRVDCDFPSHPKTLRFIRLCAHEAAPYALIRLWLWAAERRQDGDLFRLDAADIERAVGWWGTPGKFVIAARECGFIEGKEGRLRIHDWDEKQGYHAREALRKSAKRARGKPESARAQSGNSARLEERRLDQIREDPPYSPPRGDGAFDRFWSAYPKKVGRKVAERAYERAVKGHPDLQAKILDAVEAQKGSEQWRKDGGQFIPHPATWLNQGRWDDAVGPANSEKPPGYDALLEDALGIHR